MTNVDVSSCDLSLCDVQQYVAAKGEGRVIYKDRIKAQELLKS